MTLATPVDREFRVLPAGFIRDKVVLANLREGLRVRTNPDTGSAFTEEEIARITAPGSRFHVAAQAIDDEGQLDQRNALYIADQIRLERASDEWLKNYHAPLWGEDYLPASGASGIVQGSGVASTVIVGSTVLGDPGAVQARDGAGNLYQVFLTTVIDAFGQVKPTLAAVTTGSVTNLPAGATLTWTNAPPGLNPTAIVEQDFTGGTDRETSAELASRLAQIIREKPGAGNNAQQRMWARKSTNAVEDAFIYPCALNAGSFIATVTQKRGKTIGPLARIPSTSTLLAARAYLTPPTSPVQPSRPFVIVTPPVAESSDLIIQLSMQRSSNAGWRDSQPFPKYPGGGVAASITSLLSQTEWYFNAPGDPHLPGLAAGATATAPNVPHIALWNPARSEWVSDLAVLSIEHVVDTIYNVLLSAPPPFTIVPGMWVSPATKRAPIIGQALVDYFDELGPGDFFDTATDPRGGRCVRFPEFRNEWPMRAGAEVVTGVLAALGGTTADGTLAFISPTVPSYQPSLQLGPKMLTLGRAAIYEL